MDNVIDLTSHFKTTRGMPKEDADFERKRVVDKLTAKGRDETTIGLLRQVSLAAENVLYNPLDDFDRENLRNLLQQAEDHLWEVESYPDWTDGD